MTGRIGFVHKSDRVNFFKAVKDSGGCKNWKSCWERFGLKRHAFQTYLYGERLIPKSVFEELLVTLPIHYQEEVKLVTFQKEQNWGAIKGGKTVYQKYPEEFKQRQKNGILKILENSKNRINTIAQDYQNIKMNPKIAELVGAFIGDG